MRALHHVGITVRDLDASIRFSHDVLGLGFVNEPSPWFDHPREEGRARGQGNRVLQRRQRRGRGRARRLALVYFADPDGYPLELVQIAYARPEERAQGIAAYLASRGEGRGR